MEPAYGPALSTASALRRYRRRITALQSQHRAPPARQDSATQTPEAPSEWALVAAEREARRRLRRRLGEAEIDLRQRVASRRVSEHEFVSICAALASASALDPMGVEAALFAQVDGIVVQKNEAALRRGDSTQRTTIEAAIQKRRELEHELAQSSQLLAMLQERLAEAKGSLRRAALLRQAT